MKHPNLHEVAHAVFVAQDRLADFWKQVDEEQFIRDANPQDVAVLKDLILRRIYPVNAFGALVKIDQEAAIELLLARYLGKGVDPDTKFGGFGFELDTMLDDLFQVGGESLLSRLVCHPQFAVDRTSDPRVSRILGGILEIDEEKVAYWVAAQSIRV